MNTNHLTIAAGPSDEALLDRMKALSAQSRHVTVELVAHLMEVARRGLHRGEGSGKLFGYFTQVPAGTNPDSRDIDAAVQRAVWTRDGGQCAFIGRHGLRCTERSYLEFHHQQPFALGGGKTADNISLRCRAHNVYEAELVFGASLVRETALPYGGRVCFETSPPFVRARILRARRTK